MVKIFKYKYRYITLKEDSIEISKETPENTDAVSELCPKDYDLLCNEISSVLSRYPFKKLVGLRELLNYPTILTLDMPLIKGDSYVFGDKSEYIIILEENRLSLNYKTRRNFISSSVKEIKDNQCILDSINNILYDG